MVNKKQPQRMCTGCGTMRDKRDMIRVVHTPEGQTLIDKKGKLSGRGAYVCPNGECFRKAVKTRRLERNLKVSVPQEVYDQLEKEIEAEND